MTLIISLTARWSQLGLLFPSKSIRWMRLYAFGVNVVENKNLGSISNTAANEVQSFSCNCARLVFNRRHIQRNVQCVNLKLNTLETTLHPIETWSWCSKPIIENRFTIHVHVLWRPQTHFKWFSFSRFNCAKKTKDLFNIFKSITKLFKHLWNQMQMTRF